MARGHLCRGLRPDSCDGLTGGAASQWTASTALRRSCAACWIWCRARCCAWHGSWCCSGGVGAAACTSAATARVARWQRQASCSSWNPGRLLRQKLLSMVPGQGGIKAASRPLRAAGSRANVSAIVRADRIGRLRAPTTQERLGEHVKHLQMWPRPRQECPAAALHRERLRRVDL